MAYPDNSCPASQDAPQAKSRKKLSPAKVIILCVLGVLLLTAGILAILIGTRADVTLDALTEAPDKTSFLFRYGTAQLTYADEWKYRDTLTFHGIPLSSLTVHWDEDFVDATGGYTYWFAASGNDGQQLHTVIRENCDYIKTGDTVVADDGSSFYSEYYRYHGTQVEVTFCSSGSVHVSISP